MNRIPVLDVVEIDAATEDLALVFSLDSQSLPGMDRTETLLEFNDVPAELFDLWRDLHNSDQVKLYSSSVREFRFATSSCQLDLGRWRRCQVMDNRHEFRNL
jgi:hypothetical protein